jgi:hypothetical protein
MANRRSAWRARNRVREAAKIAAPAFDRFCVGGALLQNLLQEELGAVVLRI